MDIKKKNNNISTVLFLLGIILIALGLFSLFSDRGEQSAVRVTSFEECVEAGHPVEESYPARCGVPGGETFTQDIGNELEKDDLIRVDSPRPGNTVSAVESFSVTGEARGTWYFEASFPVELKNQAGQTIGAGIAEAQSDWMTEDFVPFVAEITLESDYSGAAELILRRDNPSGLPENDDELIVPIVFEGTVSSGSQDGTGASEVLPRDGTPIIATSCYVGGCSGQICSSSPDVVSTCEWREEYACYKESVCELQANNECGWTETAEFLACMDGAGTGGIISI